MNRILARGLTVALAALLCGAAAHAADPATDAMLAAYVPYRAALFRTNSAAQAESERALADAQRAWQVVQQRFAAAPPVPYAGDAGFAATLQQVATVYTEADRLVRAGQLPQAHDALEQVRDLLADLRQRNGVVVFSDAMNDYHAEMEHVLGEGPKALQQSQGWMQLMARAGTLDYLAARLIQQAGTALKANAEFTQGQRAVAESVAALRAALLAQDAAAVQKALSGLKGPYSRLFLKFG
jgi:hypothetical protein